MKEATAVCNADPKCGGALEKRRERRREGEEKEELKQEKEEKEEQLKNFMVCDTMNKVTNKQKR